jgi:predicted nucleotidyltransferase
MKDVDRQRRDFRAEAGNGYGGDHVTMQPDYAPPNPARDMPHLRRDEARLLECIIERLAQAYRPEQIYLFGSKARNDSGPDSDFDLLVIVPDTVSDRERSSRLAYEVLRGTGTSTDVVVWTRSDFQSRVPLAASLPATVVREGIVLYAA